MILTISVHVTRTCRVQTTNRDLSVRSSGSSTDMLLKIICTVYECFDFALYNQFNSINISDLFPPSHKTKINCLQNYIQNKWSKIQLPNQLIKFNLINFQLGLIKLESVCFTYHNIQFYFDIYLQIVRTYLRKTGFL